MNGLLNAATQVLVPRATPSPPFTPVMDPPDGVTANYTNPEDMSAPVYRAAWSCTACSLLLVSLRLYTRIFVAGGLGLDDYAITFAMWEIASSAVYAPATSLAKISIALFLLRLTPKRSFRVTLYVVLFVIFSYCLCSILTLILGCLPVKAIWDLTVTNSHCIDRNSVILVLSIFNICTDFTLLIIPMLIVIPLQMPRRQKFGLVAIFLSGGLLVDHPFTLTASTFGPSLKIVCATAIVRTALLKPLFASPDYTWNVVDQYVWSFIEINVGICCACFPCLKPLLRRYLPRLISGKTSGRSSRSRPPFSDRFGASMSKKRGHSYPLESMEGSREGCNRDDGLGVETIVSGRMDDGDNESTEEIYGRGEAVEDRKRDASDGKGGGSNIVKTMKANARPEVNLTRVKLGDMLDKRNMAKSTKRLPEADERQQKKILDGDWVLSGSKDQGVQFSVVSVKNSGRYRAKTG
ncbi:MAG: hypothetical protein M1834_005402 [Cirrosporium novae-zelandiae]|nr:MAG: hypothetical protein M1834_005402 [Cirrosporium novae-zelandiae]